jgi:curli biogenesis system outer membrane secretion channel CsgG
MKKMKALTSAAAIAVLGFSLMGCASSDQSFSATAPGERQGPLAASGKSLSMQLREAAASANPNVVFAVGKCDDETGKFLDGDQLRYSRAVTQACTEIISNYVHMAGFKVAERTPFNMQLMAQEYSLSHTFAPQAAAKGGAVPPAVSPPKNIGLIQHGGPQGGLIGATYMWTGAIVQYNSNVNTGGGGVAVDAIGASVQRSIAHVGIVLRLVDMSTGLVVSSLNLQTTITGKSVDFHLTRFIGDVATGVATSLTGGVASTVLPASNAHILSAELGGAMQAPIDYAVTDVIVASIARQLEANQNLFYTKRVQFDYNTRSSS